MHTLVVRVITLHFPVPPVSVLRVEDCMAWRRLASLFAVFLNDDLRASRAGNGAQREINFLELRF